MQITTDFTTDDTIRYHSTTILWGWAYSDYLPDTVITIPGRPFLWGGGGEACHY